MSPTRILLAAAAVAALGAAPLAAQAQAPAPTSASASAIKVQGDLLDTLKLSGQFTTFVAGVDATNLSSLLKTQPQITVFAPTDAAFASMPADKLAALKADKAAMQKFILHHMVNAPIDSTKIKGAKGEIPSAAGDKILLDGSDEGGKMMVDGATIVQADLKTASGLLQVVDKPLIAGAGGSAAPAEAAAATPPAGN
jgi:uncharacterized surface protein with fasciclin (FAS1) repeats